MATRRTEERINAELARVRLGSLWQEVSQRSEIEPALSYLVDTHLVQAIHNSINHAQVSYRFCLPIQLLGKLCNHEVDALALQRGLGSLDQRSWDARSLGSRVIAPFNIAQENVLGTSLDPYVGNAMRIARMLRSDTSKKDLVGWNVLIDVLESVETANDPSYTEMVLRQVLLEFKHRQRSLQFSYPVPPRTGLATTLQLASEFLSQRSGGDRALAVSGALFDVIGGSFGLFAKVVRARINASDEASGLSADLECLDANDQVVMVVEVKDRALKLMDIEGTISKTRQRGIRDVFFAAPNIDPSDAQAIHNRIATTFAAGQNLYVSDVLVLAQAVLALGGEASRTLFLVRVGEHLDTWNTQPSHRQAWKKLLETL